MAMHLIGLYLMGVYLIRVYLVGMHLIGMHFIDMHLMGIHLKVVAKSVSDPWGAISIKGGSRKNSASRGIGPAGWTP